MYDKYHTLRRRVQQPNNPNRQERSQFPGYSMSGRFYGGRIHPSRHGFPAVRRVTLDRNPIEGNQ
jgi:hypothetical protein